MKSFMTHTVQVVDFFGWKTCENVVVLDFLAVDNFDFTTKIVKKILGEKLVKMLGFCQNWIFGQKFDFSNSVNEKQRRKNEFSKLQNIAYDDKLTVVEMHKITSFLCIDNFRSLVSNWREICTCIAIWRKNTKNQTFENWQFFSWKFLGYLVKSKETLRFHNKNCF